MARSPANVRCVTRTFRVAATPSGYRLLGERLGTCSWLHNLELAPWRHESQRWRWRGAPYPQPSYTEFSLYKRLPAIKARHPEMCEVDNRVWRGVLKILAITLSDRRSRRKDGKKVGKPRFKPAHRYNTFVIGNPTQSWLKQVGAHWVLKIPGLPPLRLYGQQDVPCGKMLEIRITRRGRRYEANIAFEDGEIQETKPIESVVGIDMGVRDTVACSNGARFPSERSEREKERASLRKKKQRLARSRKGGKEFKRRSRIVANEYRRQRVRNRNRAHRMSSVIALMADLIVYEDLNIANMTKSASGTVENPGTNVAQKRALNRSILEQLWGMILRQLSYKAEWAGKMTVVVDPRHTSQTCYRCERIDKDARIKDQYRCRSCGLAENADVNGAVNVGYRGAALAGVEKGKVLLPARISSERGCKTGPGVPVPTRLSSLARSAITTDANSASRCT